MGSSRATPPLLPAVWLLLALPAATLGAPVAGAEPVCAPACEVPSRTEAFLPPVVVVTSGAHVTWSSQDGVPHTATSSELCLHVVYDGTAPRGADFRISGDRLLVKSPERLEKPCTSATPLPEGGFSLPYVCLYHSQMTGRVVVLPAPPA